MGRHWKLARKYLYHGVTDWKSARNCTGGKTKQIHCRRTIGTTIARRRCKNTLKEELIEKDRQLQNTIYEVQKLKQRIENLQDPTELNDASKRIQELEENIQELKKNLEEAQQIADETLKDEELLKNQIRQEKEKVKELIREGNDAIQRLRQFEVNVKYEQEEELYKLRQEYEQKLQQQQQQQGQEDIKKIKQEYLSSVQKIQQQTEEKIKNANISVNEMQETLVRAVKKLSWLENSLEELEFAKIALEQQDQAINMLQERLAQEAGGNTADEGSREIGGILAGAVHAVDDVKEIIDRENPNEKDKNKIIFGKLEGLKKQANKFKEFAENSRGYKKSEYEAFEKITKIQADTIRLEFDIKPREEETMQKLKEETKNNDQVKFEKFKKGVKENGFALSGVMIGIGGIIAVVASAFRSTVQTVARGAYGLGKGVAKILSKLGPLFSALGSILSVVLGFASQALMWISKNLWILLVFLAMFLWRKFKYLSKFFFALLSYPIKIQKSFLKTSIPTLSILLSSISLFCFLGMGSCTCLE